MLLLFTAAEGFCIAIASPVVVLQACKVRKKNSFNSALTLDTIVVFSVHSSVFVCFVCKLFFGNMAHV